MTSSATSTTVVVPGTHLMTSLVGPRDQFLRRIEQRFPAVLISVRGNEIRIVGEDTTMVADASRLFEELVTLLETGQQLDDATLELASRHLAEGVDQEPDLVVAISTGQLEFELAE